MPFFQRLIWIVIHLFYDLYLRVIFLGLHLQPCLVLLTEVKLTHSGGGGEYIFPLHGHCHHPKPQGPFTIRAGQSIPVQFKNVFSAPTTFLLSVDNPLFSVKQSELIRAKKTINIMVTYNGSPR